MFMWGYLDCIHLLDVFWNNNAGHAAFGFGNTHGTINQMADLHWATCQRNVFIRHVFEERDQIDLTVDPPPDLVIEIDISRSSLDRFPIFANIGVLEVWRYDGTCLTIFTLRAGTYQEVAASAVFPGVTSQIISQFIEESATMPHTVWLRRVRAWARRQRRGGHKPL